MCVRASLLLLLAPWRTYANASPFHALLTPVKLGLRCRSLRRENTVLHSNGRLWGIVQQTHTHTHTAEGRSFGLWRQVSLRQQKRCCLSYLKRLRAPSSASVSGLNRAQEKKNLLDCKYSSQWPPICKHTRCVKCPKLINTL